MKKISQAEAEKILNEISVVMMDDNYPLNLYSPPNDDNEDLLVYLTMDDPEEGFVELFFPKNFNEEVEVDGTDMYLYSDIKQRVKFTMYQTKNIE